MRDIIKNLLILLSVLMFLCLLGFLFQEKVGYFFFAPRLNDNFSPRDSETKQANVEDIKIVAQNLDIPWEIAFLPDGDMLVTERPGKLLRIGIKTKVIKEIEGVRHIGEGGLLGLALHPNFSKNNYLYIYSTTQGSSGITNRVERYKLSGDQLAERKVILEGIKGSVNHDGGRIAFGPDGYLYISTGDAESPNLAQDTNSLNGKILRIGDDGSIPPDNPFNNPVYSLGHRNPQGLAWDKDGTLWETEHGPSGLQTGNDEVNIIIKGANYGWPVIKGAQEKDGYLSPVIQSGTNDTWAPSGLAYFNGRLFFSGLRGQALYEARIRSGNKLDLITHFKSKLGRIRAVVLGPDGFIYLSTSNKDGRGQPAAEDDKIIRINPQIIITGI